MDTELTREELIGMAVCPDCREDLVVIRTGSFHCIDCGKTYGKYNDPHKDEVLVEGVGWVPIKTYKIATRD